MREVIDSEADGAGRADSGGVSRHSTQARFEL